MIDNCLGVAAIALGITEVGLLSTIVAAPATERKDSSGETEIYYCWFPNG